MYKMYEKVQPEIIGIPSRSVQKFFSIIEANHLPFHSVILARGTKIFAEAYWSPFHKDFMHRMYSQTKSFVGIAVCQLAAEGKIHLDDKIIDYFPDKIPDEVHPWLAAQTIRHMLRMETCMGEDSAVNWFSARPLDRLSFYFHAKPVRYPGTTFYYDSNGSFVLSALVERISGKDFLQFLREKCLDAIGFSENAYCLKAPGGYLWGDSALLCTTRDMLKFMRLVANDGKYNKVQLLSSEAVREAVKQHTQTSSFNLCGDEDCGYGYQIWKFRKDSIAFNGMHGQFSIYNPATDIIMACNAGLPRSVPEGLNTMVFQNFFENIVDAAKKDPLTKNPHAALELEKYCQNLRLLAQSGKSHSNREAALHGKRFTVENVNPMGIKEFALFFEETGGCLEYINAQGKKRLAWGWQKNIFQKFPQTGYSKEVGSRRCVGHQYDCAVSAAWSETEKLVILVQIIDEYIGLSLIHI